MKAVKPFVISPDELGMENNSMLNLEAMKSLKVDEYVRKINSALRKEKTISRSIAEEMYYIGRNVNAKYKYLQYSTYSFFGGIILSILLIII